MRKSRDSLMREVRRLSPEEWAQIALNLDHPLNVCWRQVMSYWEMAAGFVKHGVLHADLFAENCGEALIVYARVQSVLPKIRETAPTALANIEWLIEHSAEARTRLERYRTRFAPPVAAKP